MGAKAGRFIGELCTQGRIEGSNDTDHLALHNKRTKSTCGLSTFQKESNNIRNYHFKSRTPSKVASKEPEESNVA